MLGKPSSQLKRTTFSVRALNFILTRLELSLQFGHLCIFAFTRGYTSLWFWRRIWEIETCRSFGGERARLTAKPAVQHSRAAE